MALRSLLLAPPRWAVRCRFFWRAKLDHWRAVGVKAGDGRLSPRLALGAVGLGPDDWLPIGIEDEVAAGRDLDAVAAGFAGIEKEALRDGVLAGGEFDGDAMFQVDVRRAQHILTVIDPVRDMVQPPG